MKIVCVGGGPAGLYFALLTKKAAPHHDITVIERNAPRQTFGWGVVFSDETLGYLQENDPPSYAEIAAGFAHWDAIDVFVRGEAFRSGGHGFSGIARKNLLGILQRRCDALGVVMRFDTEVEDLESLRREADLVVVGDGVNSRARALYADTLRPSLEMGKCRYIWLGTTRLFEAFTFAFEQSEHGIFQAHAYRFDDERSTFIVETDEATWQRAGLDAMPVDDGVRWLETLFARHLQGHALMTNRSTWISFPTVRNERWSHDNLVIVGDACHTAHFSIGSGTKLAMEDSIGLSRVIVGASAGGGSAGLGTDPRAGVGAVPGGVAGAGAGVGAIAGSGVGAGGGSGGGGGGGGGGGAAVERRADVPAALERYEAERRPVVERTQRAAQDSRVWFENVARYWSFPPREFAFSMLTRSKKISFDNLRVRDAGFVDAVASDYARRVYVEAGEETPVPLPPPMFTPLKLRGMTLVNRVGVSPMCMYSATNGTPDDFHLVHLGSRAMGGAGLVMTEMTDVAADARITPGCTGMYLPEHVAAWRRVVDFVHARTQAKIGMQLGHAGRKGATKLPWISGYDVPLDEGAWPVIGPSPVAYSARMQVPREMTRADMDRVRDEHVRAATMAAESGFDLLELHMAHGYLLSTFLTPLANRRADDYGGSVENRMRFPLEVFSAMRAVWPDDRPMSVRVSASDWAPGGVELDDMMALGRALKQRGLDILDVSSGQTVSDERPIYGRMFQVPFSDAIRNEVGLPTMAVGAIMTSDNVNSVITAGRADVCLLAREHLRDPYFSLRAAAEQGWHGMSWPAPYLAAKPIKR